MLSRFWFLNDLFCSVQIYMDVMQNFLLRYSCMHNHCTVFKANKNKSLSEEAKEAESKVLPTCDLIGDLIYEFDETCPHVHSCHPARTSCQRSLN